MVDKSVSMPHKTDKEKRLLRSSIIYNNRVRMKKEREENRLNCERCGVVIFDKQDKKNRYCYLCRSNF